MAFVLFEGDSYLKYTIIYYSIHESSPKTRFRLICEIKNNIN
jgi:hypothetical protein